MSAYTLDDFFAWKKKYEQQQIIDGYAKLAEQQQSTEEKQLDAARRARRNRALREADQDG